MILSLNNANLKLPTAVAFDSLTNLSLSDIQLTADSGGFLGHLLSSACSPRLQKLSLNYLDGLTELQLEARELLELSLEGALYQGYYARIELNTPKLRVLNLEYGPLETLIISAPKLEELTSSFIGWPDVKQLDIGGMPCVRRMDELHFDLIKNIPQLHHVTSLTIILELRMERTIMTGTACLLARCRFLRFLQLYMNFDIKEIDIRRFQGRKYETSLMELLYESSPALQKIKLNFQWNAITERRNLLRRFSFAEVGISLNDDVLAHILASLPTIADVVRACAVSRRRHHLQPRVPNLRFSFTDDISYQKDNFDDDDYLKQREKERVDGYISFVNRHVVKSFSLKLNYVPSTSRLDNNNNKFNSNKVIYELPSYTRLESMILSLNCATLKLPINVIFDSMTDFSLSNMRLVEGSGHLMSSVCCPCLRKLSLDEIDGLTELKLEANELMDLTLLGESCVDVFIELITPRLRVLKFDYIFLGALKISAQNLEEFSSTFVHWRNVEMGQLDMGDLSCVRILSDLELCSHGNPVDYANYNKYAIYLLQRCTSVECLRVFLYSAKLNIATIVTTTADNQATWKDHFRIKLPHLHEIQISGLLGLEYETSLMEALYESSPVLQKIQVKFDNKTAESKILLPRIPFNEVGRWETAPTADSDCKTLSRVAHWEFNVNPIMVLNEFPGSEKLEMMSLTLSGVGLRIPSNVTFHSLTHLSLINVLIEGGSVHLINRLLSPMCCPRLQRLRLHKVYCFKGLQLESSELVELSMKKMSSCGLELKTPNLRILRTEKVHLERLAILAPRLEEFTPSAKLINELSMLNIGDMPWGQTLRDITIRPRAHIGDYSNRNTIRLLRCCKFLRFLNVHLHLSKEEEYNDGEVDSMEDIPQLPHVTWLSIKISSCHFYGFTTSVARLLERCRFLKYLDLDMEPTTNEDQKGHDNISLEYLQEIKIINLHGQNNEARFIKLLYASAPVLKKMTVAFSTFGRHEKFLHQIAKKGKWLATFSRKVKRRRRDRSNHGGGAGRRNLIDHLGDDVLVHVIRFLPTHTDVARACAVSRRWRRLEPLAPVLRFVYPDRVSNPPQERIDRFVAFTNKILARRADQSDNAALIEHLSISLRLLHYRPHRMMKNGTEYALPFVDVAHVNDWIRYGLQRVSNSFALELSLPQNYYKNYNSNDDSNDGMVLDELPDSTKLETIILSLSNACLRFSAAVVYESVTHLSLKNVRLEEDSSRLLSTCCPRLKKLNLCGIVMMAVIEFHLKFDELIELSLDWIPNKLLVLEINTPRLHVLSINHMYVERLVNLAPRLEEFTFSNTTVVSMLDIRDTSCVRVLKRIELRSLRPNNYHDGPYSRTRIQLLQCCKFLEFLELNLSLSQEGSDLKEEFGMMKDIPQFPRVTSLSLQVSSYTVCGITTGSARVGSQKQMDHHIGIIPLEYLHDIKVNGIRGIGYDAWLMKFLYASAPNLKKMTVTFLYAFQRWHVAEMVGVKSEEFLNSITFAKEGKWVSCYNNGLPYPMFEWMPIKESKDVMQSTVTVDAKRRRPNSPPPPDHHTDGGGDGVNLISHLADDVLLHIIRFLPDAKHAVRTAAISRRWRHLWTRAAVLRSGTLCSAW
uniref:F-box domain-containing protein n=1 Tax=Leersia perrieri TaxID=77586 RepID=A0A0D9W0R4_9ORYZ